MESDPVADLIARLAFAQVNIANNEKTQVHKVLIDIENELKVMYGSGATIRSVVDSMSDMDMDEIITLSLILSKSTERLEETTRGTTH